MRCLESLHWVQGAEIDALILLIRHRHSPVCIRHSILEFFHHLVVLAVSRAALVKQRRLQLTLLLFPVGFLTHFHCVRVYV